MKSLRGKSTYEKSLKEVNLRGDIGTPPKYYACRHCGKVFLLSLSLQGYLSHKKMPPPLGLA